MRTPNFKSVSEVTADPEEGFWYILTNRWWISVPDKGLVFYGKSPLCNKHEGITKIIAAKHYPDADVIFLPRVYLNHDCEDYR